MKNASYLLLTFILLTWPCFADDEHSDKAGLSWITYDERILKGGNEAMKGEPKAQRALACSNEEGSVFKIPSDNFSQMVFDEKRVKDIPLIKDLERQVQEALAKLNQVLSPKFFAFIGGHGESGCMNTGEEKVKYSYETIFNLLLDEVDSFQKRTGKALHTELFIGSCFSGSAIPVLKKIITEREKSKKQYDVTIFTSASAGATSSAKVLWDSIQEHKVSALNPRSWVNLCTKPKLDSHDNYPHIQLVWTNDIEKMRKFVFELLDAPYFVEEAERTFGHPIGGFIEVDANLRDEVLKKVFQENDQEKQRQYVIRLGRNLSLSDRQREEMLMLALKVLPEDDLPALEYKMDFLDLYLTNGRDRLNRKNLIKITIKYLQKIIAQERVEGAEYAEFTKGVKEFESRLQKALEAKTRRLY